MKPMSRRSVLKASAAAIVLTATTSAALAANRPHPDQLELEIDRLINDLRSPPGRLPCSIVLALEIVANRLEDMIRPGMPHSLPSWAGHWSLRRDIADVRAMVGRAGS